MVLFIRGNNRANKNARTWKEHRLYRLSLCIFLGGKHILLRSVHHRINIREKTEMTMTFIRQCTYPHWILKATYVIYRCVQPIVESILEKIWPSVIYYSRNTRVTEKSSAMLVRNTGRNLSCIDKVKKPALAAYVRISRMYCRTRTMYSCWISAMWHPKTLKASVVLSLFTSCNCKDANPGEERVEKKKHEKAI